MNKFYKIKFDPNKNYTIKICSLEKRYIYYRNNFKRVCIENQELKKQIEDEIYGRDMVVNLNSNLKQENKKLEKVIELLHNLFYEYISIRPMSGIKFLNDKGITNCKICEKDLESGISCKECIKQQIFKKVDE